MQNALSLDEYIPLRSEELDPQKIGISAIVKAYETKFKIKVLNPKGISIQIVTPTIIDGMPSVIIDAKVGGEEYTLFKGVLYTPSEMEVVAEDIRKKALIALHS